MTGNTLSVAEADGFTPQGGVCFVTVTDPHDRFIVDYHGALKSVGLTLLQTLSALLCHIYPYAERRGTFLGTRPVFLQYLLQILRYVLMRSIYFKISAVNFLRLRPLLTST